MRISTLRLYNFRNYVSEEFDFINGINVILGENAQGKTNVLEAIFLCSCGRSHRTSKDQELVRIGSEGFKVCIEIEHTETNPCVEILFEHGQRKKIRVNGIMIKKLGELLGNIRVVMFSPENLSIINGPPQERRRFADIAISQLKSSYFFELQNYARILKQRNNLLKGMKERGKKDPTLEIWNESLTDSGSKIMLERMDFTRKIKEEAKKKHEKISGGSEDLDLSYRPSFKTALDKGKETIKESFMEQINNSSEKEERYGTTVVGPHRDEWEIRQNGMEIKEYGSQGQKRTAILSIKMAEVEMIKNETGETPVLLLDDVMSELDEKRRRCLLESVEGIQILMTTTEKDIQDEGREIKCVEIRDGKKLKT